MSPDVLAFLQVLLTQVTLQAGAPDFEDMALVVIKAKREVAEALESDKA